jgi:hypothetical protein
MFDPLGQPEGLWPAPKTARHSEPRRWVWAAMQPRDRRARLREIAVWVDWLRRTFQLHNDVPPCWFRHPSAREIITALYLGWVRTYAAPQHPSGPLAEADWINTLFALAPRLHLASCVANGHQPPPDRDAAAAALQKNTGEDFELYLAASEEMTGPARHPAEAEARRLAEEANPRL